MNLPHILYAEDNDDHAGLFLRSLEEGEFEVSVDRVADGEEAIDYLYEREKYADGHPKVDLVVLDLRMPKMDGLEVLKEIKTSQSFKLIPVVILTTSDSETDRIKAFEYHANAYVVKPFEYEKLVELADTLKLFWFQFNMAPPDAI